MLNDIRLHVDADESRQRALEHDFAKIIDERHKNNANAFASFIPSIAQVIPKLPFNRLSAFLDKHQQTNIVDFNTGNTLYGPNSDTSINIQIENWPMCSALLHFTSQDKEEPALTPTNSAPKLSCDSFCALKEYASKLEQSVMQQSPDTLVVLGLGKARHLNLLLNTRFGDTSNAQNINLDGVKHLVIYEPDWEVFRCSLATFDWSLFLHNAQHANLQVFMQVGSPLNLIFDEITELQQQLNAKKILFYKHINSPIFTNIIQNVRFSQWGRSVVEPLSLHAKQAQQTDAHLTHHLQNFSALNAKQWQMASTSNAQFKANMVLFEEYFPDIYNAFSDYRPKCWDTLIHSQSQLVNMYNRHKNSFYSGENAKQEGQLLQSHFAQHPNLDGLVFGYSGDKLKHYLHNTFIRQADMLLRQSEQSVGELPQQVKAITMFGLGSGYMLEALYVQHDIQNLIVCEPNPDFFYASLHAIDWSPIFEKVKQGEHKLYINIGEASSRLFKDLMSQFLQLGPHLLNETFIVQAYQNPMLTQVLFEVREQLKVIFSMGENFDHVAYGIAHTTFALNHKVPALRYQPAQYLSHTNKQLPIFVVGNGPSLDENIEVIKAHRDQVIVVSCGTALQSLYKNGITPDFHGEVEQNRANFDWASRINDRAYLKRITLLSVNGIHPDTYSLYKNVLFAFKTGESSTHALLATMPQDSFECLDFAYPTVTNMVMSFFLNLGFEQLYLVGVDLGFADQNKHHSSASGYYENGKQLYDYKAFHAADLKVRGNKQPWVFTKTEFNISRMIIEQLLLEYKQTKGAILDCFNLSNGVYIEGTVALTPDQVLVMSSENDKQNTLRNLENCFMSLASDVTKNMRQAYQHERLQAQIKSLFDITNVDIASKRQIQTIIDELSSLLYEARKQGKSLFFYYFFNSINYLSAALNKASLQKNKQHAIADCQRLLSLWNVFLTDAKPFIQHNLALLDTAQAYGDRRERYLLEGMLPDKQGTVYYFTFNQNLAQSAQQFQTSQPSLAELFELPNLASIESLLYTESSISHITQKFVFDVGGKDECEKIAAVLNSPTTLIANVGLIFHDYQMLSWFEHHYPSIARQVCLIYCSPLINQYLSIGLEKSQLTTGVQDYLFDIEYFHQILARSQDLKRFSQIVCKPQFNKTGLKNAREINKDDTSGTTRQIQSVQGGIYNDGGAVTLASQIDPADGNDTKRNTNFENEYTCVSVNTIEQRFNGLLQRPLCFMFKQYIALPCRNDMQSHETKKTAQISSLPMTKLDTLENRGLLINRQLFAFEVLGAWHAEDEIEIA